jgi:hypothetical protein
MKWNVGQSKSPDNKYSPERGSIMPKSNLANSGSRNRNVLMSKSSMMGVLGVVPEENDSDDEDAHLKGDFRSERHTISYKCKISCKRCSKNLNEKPAFNICHMILQCIYVFVLFIYFFMAFDVDDKNIKSFNIIFVVFLNLLLLFSTLVLAHKGCRTMVIINYLF